MHLLEGQKEAIEKNIRELMEEQKAYHEIEFNQDYKNNEITDTIDPITRSRSTCIPKEIRELKLLLENSQIIEMSTDDTIQLGTTFKCAINFGDEIVEEEYTLVETKEGLKGNYISVDSPIGKSVVSKKVNETFEYLISNGYKVKGIITEVQNKKEKQIQSLRYQKLLQKYINRLEKKNDLEENISNMHNMRQLIMLNMELQRYEMLLQQEYGCQKTK